MRDNPYSLPDSVLSFQKERGIKGFKCDNGGLLFNWREVRQCCDEQTVARLLGQAAMECAARSGPCKDLRVCLGLGLDPLVTIGRAREAGQHDLVGGMQLEVRDVSVLARIVAAAPIGELGPLCDEGYLPRFSDSIPDVGLCVSKKSAAFGRRLSLLEYMLAQDCDSDRISGTLGMFDVESDGIQQSIARAIQFVVDEVAANCSVGGRNDTTGALADDAVFKVAAVICACDEAYLRQLRPAEDGKQTLLHALAREGTEKTVNDQLIIRGGVEEKFFYGAIERMTAHDPATGVAPFDVNARDELGRPPIFYAFERGDIETCSRLLAAGADLEAKDNAGVSIDQLADRIDAENRDDVMERHLLEWRATSAHTAVERVLRSARGMRQ